MLEGLEKPILSHCFWATINQKSLTEHSVRDFCGEDEIRTRGTE